MSEEVDIPVLYDEQGRKYIEVNGVRIIQTASDKDVAAWLKAIEFYKSQENKQCPPS